MVQLYILPFCVIESCRYSETLPSYFMAEDANIPCFLLRQRDAVNGSKGAPSFYLILTHEWNVFIASDKSELFISNG